MEADSVFSNLVDARSERSAIEAARHGQRGLRTGFVIWSKGMSDEGLMAPLPAGKISVVISGVARGGTSWAASVCHHLGVDLGRHGPRYENQRLARALLSKDMEALKLRLGESRAATVPHGWKLPALNYCLPEVSDLLTRHRFILVFRDPVAVALHKQSTEATRGDPISDLKRGVEAFDRICDFARHARRPCLLLAYEKGLRDPTSAVLDIAGFLGYQVTIERARAIVAAVEADRSTYRNMRHSGVTGTGTD